MGSNVPVLNAFLMCAARARLIPTSTRSSISMNSRSVTDEMPTSTSASSRSDMSMSPKSAESSLDAIVVAEGRFGPYSALEHPRSFFIDHRIAAFPVMTHTLRFEAR